MTELTYDELQQRNLDLACEICQRGTETTEQVTNNRMKLIYGLMWHKMGAVTYEWQLIKSFLSMSERSDGIYMARELLKEIENSCA